MKSWCSGWVLPRGGPNVKFQLAIPTYPSNMLQYRRKGEICNLDVGTNKEKMGTPKWPRFSEFYWPGVWVGRRNFALMKTGCLRGVSCSAGTEGQGESLGLPLPCFPIIRSLPFHRRPIWKRSAQHDNGRHPHSGNSQKQVLATHQGGDRWVQPLKPERSTG